MTDDRIQQLIKKMSTENEISLALPKFELSFESSLKDILIKLGIHDAFDEDLADFREMKKQKDIHINNILQKAYLKVDEEGTEAAAVTAVIMDKSITADEEPKLIIPFIIDRPFLFLIRNRNMPKNYEMLFMSKIEIL